jgi:hypothetical protein
VLICQCEKRLALTFLPHQVGFAHEYGTGAHIPVDGFAPRMCAQCRGVTEEPHPMAEIWGLKSKGDRFYWREIFKTYCELLLEHNRGEFPFEDVNAHDSAYPELAKQLRKEARQYWQRVHRQNPKYDTKERTEAEFFNSVPVPIRQVEARYQRIEREGQKIGKWLNDADELVSAEELVTLWYEKQGFQVLRCERRLISVWVATFLGVPIQDPTDPKSRTVMRASTIGCTPDNRDTPMITFNLPEDFGSAIYFHRRQAVLKKWLQRMRKARDLMELYDSLLPDTQFVRDYFWVAEHSAIELGRKAIQILPGHVVAASVTWAIQHFWNRQPGWPDLLIARPNEYRFSEVKTPHDKLSQDQMNWLEWAVTVEDIPCELVRVQKLRE